MEGDGQRKTDGDRSACWPTLPEYYVGKQGELWLVPFL